MARQPRRSLPDFGVFHVTARGAGDTAIYHDDIDRLRFLELVTKSAVRFDWICHAYCLMTTHYHLVLEADNAALSRGMARLNGRYAQEFNDRHGRHGHLFGSRFVAYVVDTEEHFEIALRYVLDNPVRAGLCAEPETWRWSGLGLPGEEGQSLSRMRCEKQAGTVPALTTRGSSAR
jgi:REP element-mobilizing transposase RayT